MEKISAEIVRETWQALDEVDADCATEMANGMGKQQPVVLAYLMTATENYSMNQDESELLIFLGLSIWKMMTRAEGPLPSVTPARLDEIEENNLKMLEYLAGESDEDFITTVEMIIDNYPQSEILRYVVDELMLNNQVPVSDENKGHMLISLKTAIDCLNYVRDSA